MNVLMNQEHVKITNMKFKDLEVNDDTKDLLIPSPLFTKPPVKTSETKESDKTSLTLEEVLYNNYREDFLNNIDNWYNCESCAKLDPKSQTPLPDPSLMDEKFDPKPASKTSLPDGQKMRFIVRKSFILEAPKRLVLTLKRFKRSADSSEKGVFTSYTKNNSRIVYGEHLDISKYTMKKKLGETFKYELEGVICHTGTLQNGHYTAYALQEVMGDKIWYYYNDQYAKPVDVKDVLNNSSAFVLVYRRLL